MTVRVLVLVGDPELVTLHHQMALSQGSNQLIFVNMHALQIRLPSLSSQQCYMIHSMHHSPSAQHCQTRHICTHNHKSTHTHAYKDWEEQTHRHYWRLSNLHAHVYMRITKKCSHTCKTRQASHIREKINLQEVSTSHIRCRVIFFIYFFFTKTFAVIYGTFCPDMLEKYQLVRIFPEYCMTRSKFSKKKNHNGITGYCVGNLVYSICTCLYDGADGDSIHPLFMYYYHIFS